MEDFPTDSSEKQITLKNKNRFLRGNFFASWLQSRQQINQAESLTNKEDEEDDEKKETKQNGFLNKLVKHVRGMFKKQVKIDLLPDKVETYNSETSAPLTEINNETNESDAEMKRILNTPEHSQDKEIIEGGLLPVSADAIQRYQNESETQDVNNSSRLETRLPVPMYSSILKSENVTLTKPEVNESAQSNRPDQRESIDNQALSTGEILQRRQEKRLKREVTFLKKEAVSAKKERQVVKKQQKDFQRKLIRQEQINQEVFNKPFPKTEQYLNNIPNKSSAEQISEPNKLTNISSSLKPNRDILPELQNNKIKELVNSDSDILPEVIQHKVEAAAEHNIPIENLYERRHEIKDEQPLDSYFAAKSSDNVSQLSNQYIRLQKGYGRLSQAVLNKQKSQLADESSQNSIPYKQAIQSGFWSGVVVCIFLIIILLIN